MQQNGFEAIPRNISASKISRYTVCDIITEHTRCYPVFADIWLSEEVRPGIEASVSPDISVDSHVILYNEWVCDKWWFTCSHYLDSVQGGATALWVAAQNGHVRAVELLIAAEAQVDIQQKVRFKL